MKNAEPLIQVFCRTPILGEVKTRLVQGIGEKGALDLHQQMIDRIVSCLLHADLDVELWISPDKDHVFFDRYPSDRFQQSGDDLGARMQSALQDGLARYETVILVGTDLPLIDAQYIELAAASLRNNDVVLGPAEDGGYGLVGVRGSAPDIFSGVDWGTEHVLSQTCEILNGSKLPYGLLPLVWDVDEPADLQRYKDWLDNA